jgi:hypothetical protein
MFDFWWLGDDAAFFNLTNNRFIGAGCVLNKYMLYGFSAVGNTFENCSCQRSTATMLGLATPYDVVAEFRDNVVRNCSSYTVFYFRSDDSTMATMINNTFENNVAVNERTTAFVNSRRVVLRNNRFNNPDNRIEMTLYGDIANRFIDAAYNWWGSADDTFVRSRVMDRLHSPFFMRAQYHPYCLDQACTAYSANTTSWEFFINANAVGGLLSTNATVPPGDYTCFGFDIPAGLRLELSAGVTCRFAITSTFRVNGQLSMPGTPSQPIVLTSMQSPPSPGDWGVVYFATAQLNTSTMSNVQMEYGGYDRYATSRRRHLFFFFFQLISLLLFPHSSRFHVGIRP